MESKPAARALLRSRTTYGTFVGLGSTVATEVCAIAGFDWLLFDLEHGAGNEKDLIGQLAVAKRHGVVTTVRVETASRIRCGRVLDLGVDGVMAPRLESAAEAAAFVAHLRYPPDGDRGVATYHSAAAFGMDSGYLARANDEVVTIVQIETLGALSEVVAIAATPGIDILFVGPRDFAAALDTAPVLASPVFRDGLERVVSACRDAGIVAGILAGDAATAAHYRDMGFGFIGIGSDSSFIAQGGRAALGAMQAEAEPLAAKAMG